MIVDDTEVSAEDSAVTVEEIDSAVADDVSVEVVEPTAVVVVPNTVDSASAHPHINRTREMVPARDTRTRNGKVNGQ